MRRIRTSLLRIKKGRVENSPIYSEKEGMANLSFTRYIKGISVGEPYLVEPVQMDVRTRTLRYPKALNFAYNYKRKKWRFMTSYLPKGHVT